MRALRRLQRGGASSPFLFVSNRKAPFSIAGFARNMLRHACGFKLANDGVDTRALQAYLGHRNIQHTVRYSELAPTRFKNFWRD
jgi:integrase